MAQLLVFTRNNTHDDPVVDKQGCYKIDDVIVVAEDDHVWGSAELVSPFRVVQVAGTKDDWSYLTMQDAVCNIPKSVLKIHAQRMLALRNTQIDSQRRRRYQFTNESVRKHHA